MTIGMQDADKGETVKTVLVICLVVFIIAGFVFMNLKSRKKK